MPLRDKRRKAARAATKQQPTSAPEAAPRAPAPSALSGLKRLGDAIGRRLGRKQPAPAAPLSTGWALAAPSASAIASPHRAALMTAGRLAPDAASKAVHNRAELTRAGVHHHARQEPTTVYEDNLDLTPEPTTVYEDNLDLNPEPASAGRATASVSTASVAASRTATLAGPAIATTAGMSVPASRVATLAGPATAAASGMSVPASRVATLAGPATAAASGMTVAATGVDAMAGPDQDDQNTASTTTIGPSGQSLAADDPYGHSLGLIEEDPYGQSLGLIEEDPDVALLARKSPTGTGTSRPHRAFLMSKVGKAFKHEEGAVRGELASVAGQSAHQVEILFKAMNGRIGELDPADQNTLLRIRPQVVDPADREAVYQEFWARKIDVMRRQDFDITDDGVLMHDDGSGNRVPYPLDSEGKPDIQDRTVEYDKTPEAQERTRVDFRGGKLFRSATSPEGDVAVDTAGGVTHFSGAGWQIFAVDENNEMHVASHKVGKYHHSSLLGGKNVSLGGEIKVSAGKIVALSNKSGHYMPTADSLMQLLHFLQKDGVPLDFGVVDAAAKDKTPIPADRYLAGQNADGSVATGRTYDAIKTDHVWDSLAEQFGPDRVRQLGYSRGWQPQGKGFVDDTGQPVDPRLVRRYLKQQLLGPGQKPQRKVEQRKFMSAKVKKSWTA